MEPETSNGLVCDLLSDGYFSVAHTTLTLPCEHTLRLMYAGYAAGAWFAATLNVYGCWSTRAARTNLASSISAFRQKWGEGWRTLQFAITRNTNAHHPDSPTMRE